MQKLMLEEKRREMLRLKLTMSGLAGRNKAGKLTGARRWVFRAGAGLLGLGLLMGAAAQGQSSSSSSTTDQTATQPAAPRPISTSKIALAALPTYDNRYEVFGGFNFMNFQGGQALPNRMNLGGGEVLGTYWLNRKLGLGVDYRFDAGTTPVFANGGVTSPTAIGSTGINNRPLVYLNTFMAGAQYRGPKNQYVAVSYHAYAGVSHGTFDSSFRNVLPGVNPYLATGLYTNRTKPIGALGGSLDFNRSKNFAVRLSPDLILEHFGTETREFFGISGGVIYRFGKVR